MFTIVGTVLGGLATAMAGGTGIGLLGGNMPRNGNNAPEFATKDDLSYVQELSRKDYEIALLKSEQNTEVKMADVYERIMTRVNSDQREQSAWNAQQAVNNTAMSSAIATNASSIASLQSTVNGITKTVVPIGSVCPQPMPQYNSWTSPTSTGNN